MSQWKAYVVAAVVGLPGMALAAGSSITGKVAFAGTPPPAEKLRRASDPVCAKTEVVDPSVLLTSDGKGLQNVHVRLTGANVPAAAKAPEGPVVLDQKECMYSPRVQGAVEGQTIAIRNSDGTLHNVHGYDGAKTLFNVAQPPRAPEIQKPATGKGGDVLKFKCDVHPWMTSYVLLSKHPYFATSGADGKFTLKDVPPGSYTLEAWHEKLGTQTQQVKVEAGKPAEVTFTFAAK